MNSRELKSFFMDGMMSSLWSVADGEDGVGGAAGMKNDGIEATVAYHSLAPYSTRTRNLASS
jgi:hypothetical protein